MFQKRLLDRDLLDLMKATALTHHVHLQDVYAGSHQRNITVARHACWRKLHEMKWSYTEIADLFNVHHTSVLAGTRKIKNVVLVGWCCVRVDGEPIGYFRPDQLDVVNAFACELSLRTRQRVEVTHETDD